MPALILTTLSKFKQSAPNQKPHHSLIQKLSSNTLLANSSNNITGCHNDEI